jgi:hypothetical protein
LYHPHVIRRYDELVSEKLAGPLVDMLDDGLAFEGEEYLSGQALRMISGRNHTKDPHTRRRCKANAIVRMSGKGET